MNPGTRLLAMTPTQSAHGFSADETIVINRYAVEFLLWHRDSYPALSTALLFWREARLSSQAMLPSISDLSPLLASPVGEFINQIDVSSEDPHAYRLRRSPRAQKIRQTFSNDYVTFDNLLALS